MPTNPDHPITDALVRAIAESGLSFQAIERETGVLRQSLMKFVRGEQSLRLDLAERLATFFKIRLERGVKMRAHDKGRKSFRELSLAQMRSSIAAMQRHINDARRVYAQEKERRAAAAQENPPVNPE